MNLYVLAAQRTISVESAMPLPRGAHDDSSTARRLLARARQGDRGALGRLIADWVPLLKRWAHGTFPRWARTAADTSDFVQDVVLATLRQDRTPDLPTRRALGAYLREAVRNRIHDERRRVARRGIAQTASEALVDAGPSPLDRVIGVEYAARYRAALRCLRPRDRDLIVAHVELGYTHAQLACMTGRSRNAARMALERAVRRLAAQMRAR